MTQDDIFISFQPCDQHSNLQSLLFIFLSMKELSDYIVTRNSCDARDNFSFVAAEIFV